MVNQIHKKQRSVSNDNWQHKQVFLLFPQQRQTQNVFPKKPIFPRFFSLLGILSLCFQVFKEDGNIHFLDMAFVYF